MIRLLEISLVDRLDYVYVDGAVGYFLSAAGHWRLEITRYELVVELLDMVSGNHEFDRYFSHVPFELQD